MSENSKTIVLHDLGLIDYDNAYEAQMSIHQTVLDGAESTVILCEHPPVITCGRLTREGNILASNEAIRQKGVTIKHVDRGGDVTLHAPGQLVIYTIFDLNKFGRDLHQFLHQLEEVAIAILSDMDVKASRHPEHTGVWVEDKKVVSIGIGVKKWVSYHGIGINVNTDLSLFELINPCGISARMSSLSALKGGQLELEDVKANILDHFDHVFNAEQSGAKYE